MDRVFLDTGAFIALASITDAHHEEAVAKYREIVQGKIQLVTTNHIVDETCTWLLRDRSMGHSAAVKFGQFIQDTAISLSMSEALPPSTSAGFILVYSSPEIEQKAWNIFRRYNTSGFTFTDCTSFAVMSILSITQAFTYDEHFGIMGFQRL